MIFEDNVVCFVFLKKDVFLSVVVFGDILEEEYFKYKYVINIWYYKENNIVDIVDIILVKIFFGIYF